MKNIQYSTVYVLLFVMMLTTVSCTKDFNKINTDPIGTPTATANQLLAPALVNVLSSNMLRNRSFNNELMQVTVDLGDSEGKVFRYDIRTTLATTSWNDWYKELTNLKDIYHIASQKGTENTSYQAISLISEAWVSQMLTDVYGDVPYSEANKGKEGLIEPVFDKQEDIYQDLFKKLELANTLLMEQDKIVPTGDPVYQGDISKWRRLGNSLYLRMLLRVSAKSEVNSQVVAKIKEIVDENPANYPIMEDNTHTAKILWNGTNSTTTVYSSPFMINIRAVDFRSSALADFFLGHLTNWGDPRVDPKLGVNSVSRYGIAAGPNGYVGVPSGYAQGTSVGKQAYFYSDATTNNPTTLQTDPHTGIMMNVAEVDFILAEAAAKGWIKGNAAAYYYKGIADAINYWLPQLWAGDAITKAKEYALAADMGWNDSFPLNSTLAGTQSKLELIHMQKYHALFLVDYQQWLEYRRTGHPILPKGTGLVNGGKMPARLNYPVVTQSTNPVNYRQAVAAQGPDDVNTLVWWQRP